MSGKRTEFLITRRDGFQVTDIALVRAVVENESLAASDMLFRDALRRALTRWFTTTDEGPERVERIEFRL